MALEFKVEASPKKVIIHVKGNVVELSYHAASCLCRNIIEACEERQEFNTTKFRYWKNRLKAKRKVNPNKCNRDEYDRFLAAMRNAENLAPSGRGLTGGRNRLEKPKNPRRINEEKRLAAMQAKIRELQERYHITPKKKQNDEENED